MMQQALSKILFPDTWYFGGGTYGVQGDPARHILMIATVGSVAPTDRPIRILEIGSWIGFSALTWAQAIATFVPQQGSLLCVDPWKSYFSDGDRGGTEKIYEAMDFMGRTGLAYDLFCHNVGFAPVGVKVDHIRGESAAVLPYLQKESFDIIYIDGSHYYADVLKDLKMAHELLREGGVMCGDDLELQMDECDTAFAQTCKTVDNIVDPASGKFFHPGVTLAVDEFFGKVSALRGFWSMKKTSSGYDPSSFQGLQIFIPQHFPEDYKRHCEDVFANGAAARA